MPHKSKLQTVMLSIVILAGLLPLLYFVQVEIQVAHASDNIPEPMVLADSLDRNVVNDAFGVGEKLTFDINYGFINAGTATMEVAGLIEYNNRPSYQIVTQALSNDFFSTFYRVSDRVESIMDAAGLFSWRFEKNLSEGKYRSVRISSFDPHNRLVYYQKDTVEVPPFTQDALSVFYFARTQDLQVGKSIFIDNFTDGKLYPLEVKVLKKETITVKAGTFDCIVVEPLLRSVGVFRHEGRLKVWLTDDRLKMPVLMKSKVLVGSISAELTDFRLGEIESF